MDLGWITDYFMPIIVLACLCVGYMIKKIDKIPDKYIPTIMGLLGIAFGFITNGFTFEAFTGGMLSGLASTGFHQAFKQIIENKDESV